MGTSDADVAPPLNPDALRYRLLVRALRLVAAARNSSGLLAGFVVGVVVNAASDPDVRSLGSLFVRVFGVWERPLAWLSLGPALVLVCLPLLRLLFRALLHQQSFAVAWSRTVDAHADELVAAEGAGRLRWGSHVVVQSSPGAPHGWTVDEVRLVREPQPWAPSEDDLPGYADWAAGPDGASARQGTSLRLVADPSAFTDAPELTLRVQELPYAAARYTAARLSRRPDRRRAWVEAAMRGRFLFAHTLSLHAVIVTADDWVLLTRRSHKVAYHPGAWSCSLEEQLSPRDFDLAGGSPMRRWVRRLLLEELPLTEDRLSTVDARVLAVFCETDILNVALAAVVRLPQSHAELDALLRSVPRQDVEFNEWRFVHWNGLAEELVSDEVSWHPSSGLRMLLAGMQQFGVYEFGVRVAREARRRERTRGGRRGARKAAAPRRRPAGD